MDAFFVFKRAIGMVAQPLPLALFLLVAGMLLMATARRKGWRFAAWSLLGLAAIVLAAASFPPFARFSARPLEARHAPLTAENRPETPPYAIIILGNGVAFPDDAAMPALTRLNDTARARLAEGVRLAALYPEARLVTCGYGMGLENCSDAMALAAVELGLDAGRIDRLSRAMDTDDEARLVAGLVGDRPVVLVTSAAHMPRAMAMFQNRGVRAIPAPCDFIAPVSDGVMAAVNKYRWQPKGATIAANEELWHEFLGLTYLWWVGEKE